MSFKTLCRTGVALAWVALALGADSCATQAPISGGLEPRYIAVHNALAATGLVEVGPIRRGAIAAGTDSRVPIELAAQCTTLVLLGTPGVHDLELTLLDSAGGTVAHDASHDPEAALHACVPNAGSFTLVVRTGLGSGEYVLATWTGAASPATTSAATPGAAPPAAGTCEAPIRIGSGDYSGSTTRGESENEGSCANSGARELVYRIDLAARKNVTLDVATQRFDSVLYVRKNECADESAEVACNDDAPNQHHSRIDAVFEPGTYFVFVDGYGTDGGPFQLKVAYRDVPPLSEVCGKAPLLVSGVLQNGSTSGAFDEVQASCGEGAHGPDAAFGLELPIRSRVRVREESDEFAPVVHLRKQCADESSEIGCSAAETGEHAAAFVGLLDRGSYTVFADAADHEADGRFSVLAEIVPEVGSGAPGDSCADAILLRRGESTVRGDTFRARDDTSGRCGGAGAADVIYRVEAAKRSRFVASFSSEEAAHVFVLSKMCADRSTEVACGHTLDETLPAGSYFLAVDGEAPDAFGAYSFAWSLRDIASQETGCASAPALTVGRLVSGSTAGASNKFTPSCGGPASPAGDRVYKLTLATRGRVRLNLVTPGFMGVLALRPSCLDGTNGGGRAVELGCNVASEDTNQAHLEANLEPGTYYVVVDGKPASSGSGPGSIPPPAEGPFTLQAQVVR